MNINQSDIFYTEYGHFFQVLKVSKDFVKIRPIASRCISVEPRSAHDGTRTYEPCPYVFIDDLGFWTPTQCALGTWRKVKDFSKDCVRPQIDVCSNLQAFLLTEKKVEVDYYG